MTDRPPLNPPSTPMCEEFYWLYWQWAACAPELKLQKEGWKAKIIDHRATCPVCQARMTEMTELARNAVHPEIK